MKITDLLSKLDETSFRGNHTLVIFGDYSGNIKVDEKDIIEFEDKEDMEEKVLFLWNKINSKKEEVEL